MYNKAIFEEESYKLNDSIKKIDEVKNISNNDISLIQSKIEEIPSNDFEYKTEKIDLLADIHQRRLDIAFYDELIDSPYFGHMFLNENKEDYDIYIGNHSFYDINNNHLIYDWRASTCSLFYMNQSKYKNIVVKKKRNLDIEKSKLLNCSEIIMSDEKKNATDEKKLINLPERVKITDQFLIEVLKRKKNSAEFSDIISTIQNKQNDIIRDSIDKDTIVQGVAGSGKTAIIAHRLSYLLFNNKNISPNHFLFITPNNNFKEYIDSLRVKLEIDKVIIKSIDEFYTDILNKSPFGDIFVNKEYKFIGSDELYYVIYNELKTEINNKIQNNNIENTLLFDNDVFIILKKELNKKRKEQELKKEELEKKNQSLISKLFYSNLKERINGYESNLIKIDEIINTINIFVSPSTSLDNKKESFNSLQKDYNMLVSEKFIDSNKIVSDNFIKIQKYFKDGNKKDNKLNYSEILDTYRKLRKKYIKINENRGFDRKDKLVLLKTLIDSGYKHVDNYYYIYIDEVQNYSLYEIDLINQLEKEATINLYGDVDQFLFGEKHNFWDDIKKTLTNRTFSYHELNENYRNTSNVVNYINNYIGLKMIPVGYDGNDVIVKSLTNYEEVLNYTKKLNKCVLIADEKHHKYFEQHDIKCYDVNSIMGLEFRNVVVIEEENWNNNIKYVAFTRSLNNVVIFKNNKEFVN